MTSRSAPDRSTCSASTSATGRPADDNSLTETCAPWRASAAASRLADFSRVVAGVDGDDDGLVGLHDEGQRVEGGARRLGGAVPGDQHLAERPFAQARQRHQQHRPAGFVEQGVEVGARTGSSGSGFGGEDQVGRPRAGARCDRAVARRSFRRRCHSNGRPRFVEPLLEGVSSSAARLRLISPVVITNSASGNPSPVVIGAGSGSAWMPMRWLPSREASGTTAFEQAVDVLAVLDDGDDGLVAHGSLHAASLRKNARTMRTNGRTSDSAAWFRAMPAQALAVAAAAKPGDHRRDRRAGAFQRRFGVRARTTSSVQKLPSRYFG